MGVVLDKIQLVLVLITFNELMAVPSTEYSTRTTTAILDLSSLITLGEKDIPLDLMVLEGFTGCVRSGSGVLFAAVLRPYRFHSFGELRCHLQSKNGNIRKTFF